MNSNTISHACLYTCIYEEKLIGNIYQQTFFTNLIRRSHLYLKLESDYWKKYYIFDMTEKIMFSWKSVLTMLCVCACMCCWFWIVKGLSKHSKDVQCCGTRARWWDMSHLDITSPTCSLNLLGCSQFSKIMLHKHCFHTSYIKLTLHVVMAI